MQRRKYLKWIAAVCFLFTLFFFLFRNIVLDGAIKYTSHRLKENYSAQLTIGDAGFKRLFTVHLTGLSLVPLSGDTLLNIDTLEITPSLSSLFLLRLRLSSISLSNTKINLIKKDSISNYAAFIHPPSKTSQGRKNYARQLHHLFSKTFDLLPRNMNLTDIYCTISADSISSRLHIPNVTSVKGHVEGILEDQIQHHSWKGVGEFNKSGNLNLKVFPVDGHFNLPFLNHIYQLAIGFDTLNISVDKNSFSGNIFQLQGRFSSTAFSAYHKKISDDTVFVDNLSFDYRLKISPTKLEIDSSSLFVLNSLYTHPYISFNNSSSKEYAIKIRTERTNATDFFHSLPQGMFDATRDIKAAGKLQYSLNFKLDTSQPDSVQFDSKMTKEKFGINRFGKENLSKLNGEFEYIAFEHNVPFKSFNVGPSNPDYTPLDHVSLYLQKAILTSEDGSFFFHSGFNEDAFRKSIAENYNKGSFVRGGSTITMQLVKNVFLSRHKTISRKAEEALITWIIESNHICSKERMFEVYLNIIELGPGIYGVGEASHFYFSKPPSELTLSESIFLASLLPHPKWFKYSFDEQGNLKPYLADYYRVVSNFLLKKNLITQEEFDGIQSNVKLQGPAKDIVVPTDTIPTEDSEEQ